MRAACALVPTAAAGRRATPTTRSFEFYSNLKAHKLRNKVVCLLVIYWLNTDTQYWTCLEHNVHLNIIIYKITFLLKLTGKSELNKNTFYVRINHRENIHNTTSNSEMDLKKDFNIISFYDFPCRFTCWTTSDYFSYYKTFQEEHYAHKLVWQGSYGYQHFIGWSVAMAHTTISTSLIKTPYYEVLLHK